MPKVILVVEDEPDIAQLLQANLEQHGHAVRVAGDGSTAIEMAETAPRPDLILLDVMLPDVSGIEVCRRLRRVEATAKVPIIMLTAKGEEIDRVVGFEVGADDYVTKPFSVRELILRVDALLRRAERGTESSPNDMLVMGRLRVDVQSHKVWVDDGEVALTATEFRLLTTLMTSRGRVQTREHLLTSVWGLRADTETRTVDTHVKRLREKLGAAGDLIVTLRGVGYRFTEDREQA